MTSTGLRGGPAAALATALLVAACSSPAGPEPNVKIDSLPRSLTAAEQELILAGEGFAFDFLREVAHSDDTAPNLFLSPLSASMALGMALAGAEGDTYAAMRNGIGIGSLEREEVGASYRDLLDLLAGLDPSVRLEIGNSVWHRADFDLEQGYRDAVEQDFDARVEGLEFSDPGAADVINAWVDGATDGLIERIVTPPIDPLTVAFLINAIYFEGSWTMRFDPDRTAPAEFHTADGRVVSVPFMEMSDGTFPHAWTESYHAIELPYGGEAFAMTVVLPPEGQDIDAFVDGLNAEAWRSIVEGLAGTELAVSLPKLRIEYEKNLNEALTALGMGPAFDPAVADFSRMHREALAMQLHISEVKQKAFVEVDEEGTRAAAVTSVEVGVTSAPPAFRADRPFVFGIRERLSGTLLFVGVVRDPSV